MIGSGLSAKKFKKEDYKDWIIVTVNHGYLVTEDWDYACFSTNFRSKLPMTRGKQRTIQHEILTVLGREFGGLKRTGYSIMLASSYWVLDQIKPTLIAYLGADMNYTPDDKGNTHVYGLGYDIQSYKESDPDRMIREWGKGNPNYLKEIYGKFEKIAKERGCNVCNMSDDPDTRLQYQRCKL